MRSNRRLLLRLRRTSSYSWAGSQAEAVQSFLFNGMSIASIASLYTSMALKAARPSQCLSAPGSVAKAAFHSLLGRWPREGKAGSADLEDM